MKVGSFIMTKQVTIDETVYTITDQGKYPVEEELVFEIRQGNKYVFVAGMWDEILGLPVRKVWKIVDTLIKSS